MYFPQEQAEELRAEAKRLERSMSWVIQRAWQIAREEIRKMPSAPSEQEEPTAEHEAIG